MSIRLGILGIGSMGRHHVRNARATQGVDLVALADPGGDRFGVAGDLPVLGGVEELIEAGIDGKLDSVEVEWDRRTALGVVCAARGYPAHPEKSAVIEELPENTAEQMVFHAGTALNEEGLTVVSGGRVLCVVGLGESIAAAQKSAYAAARQVKFDGMQMRSDIGYRALNR